MKSFIYKSLIVVVSTILIFEFTIGNKISQIYDKVDGISSKKGRADSVDKLRKEIKKAIKKERYLSKEDAKLLNQFFTKISKEIFLSYLQKNPTFSMAVMRKLSKNLRELDERLVNILSMRAEQRVCVEIISMARPTSVKSGFYCVVEMPTQSNFANLVGLSRETVSRILGRLRSDGLVKISGNGLNILDRKGLENRAFGQSF